METPSLSQDILELKKQLDKRLNKSDIKHLKRLIWFNRSLWGLGLLFAVYYPNPLTMLLWSLALTTNWCIVAHHILHRGYDSIHSSPKKFRSHYFACGLMRFIHWNDWIYPKAWSYEHNVLHHYYVNEKTDPDRVRDVADTYRKIKNPILNMLRFSLAVATWKPLYYCLNTLKSLSEKKEYQRDSGFSNYYLDACIKCYLPYILINFILFPLCFLSFGQKVVFFVLCNRIGAEILTNLHTFLIIVPNHAGNDIPMYDSHFKNKDEFYKRQIEGSCNYYSHSFVTDYLQGYLNYQIEHHLFPELPASQYPKIKKDVKAICIKHGIDYKESSIVARIKKTLELFLQVHNVMIFKQSSST